MTVSQYNAMIICGVQTSPSLLLHEALGEALHPLGHEGAPLVGQRKRDQRVTQPLQLLLPTVEELPHCKLDKLLPQHVLVSGVRRRVKIREAWDALEDRQHNCSSHCFTVS